MRRRCVIVLPATRSVRTVDFGFSAFGRGVMGNKRSSCTTQTASNFVIRLTKGVPTTDSVGAKVEVPCKSTQFSAGLLLQALPLAQQFTETAPLGCGATGELMTRRKLSLVSLV